MNALTDFIVASGLFEQGFAGYLFLYVCLALATALALPRQVAALSAGALFGVYYGFIVATLATITGCILTFVCCRILLSEWVHKRFPDKSKTIHQFLSKDTFTKALIIRILPLGSNFLTNVIAGATNIPFKSYVLGSVLGFIPQMVIFSLAGGGVKLAAQQEQGVMLTLTGIAVGLIITLFIKQRIQKRLSLAKP